MPKVSVIIPIWGVEQCIEKCARSLFEQTLDDLEFIFINDCTLDKSMNILQQVIEEYPQRNKQVVILHNEQNLGQSKTRKRGINTATGDYVIHCESDDWVENNWLEVLYEKAISVNADVVWCDFTRCYDDGRCVYFANTAEPTIEDSLLKLITGPKWGTLWSHLVKREIVQSPQIVWPTWNYCEDLALVFQYIALSRNIDYVNSSFYNYRYNTLSICNAIEREKKIANISGAINAILTELEICKKVGLYNKFLPYCRTEIFKARARVFSIIDNDYEACKLWRSFNDGLTFCDIWKSTMSIKDKLLFSSISLYIYPFYHKIIRS